MKVNPLDAHDRLDHVNKTQTQDISECCQDLLNKKPFGDHPFYAFVHQRTEDDGVNKRLVWQPRLTKPKAQVNTMLFKLYPGSDVVKVIWMIPQPELWESYERNKMTESSVIVESIHDFKYNRAELEAKEEDDLDDATIDKIYEEIKQEALRKKW